uniref:C-type lectin domain-containing protein n=1 Tax=Labrus bergylta TaxID=56723 RepID=A0A3Q3GUV0_9LABR
MLGWGVRLSESSVLVQVRAGNDRPEGRDRKSCSLKGLLCDFLIQQMSPLSTSMKPKQLQYHLINSQRSWYDAQKFCRVKYTDLATVGNMDDNDELLTALGHDWTYSWIGLQKGGARRWMWSDGSGPASFYKWNGGEPSGDECCVELSEKGGWNDLSCEDTKGCVCYERESKTRVTITKKNLYSRRSLFKFFNCCCNHDNHVRI